MKNFQVQLSIDFEAEDEDEARALWAEYLNDGDAISGAEITYLSEVEETPERAGPWKSGYGEYPYADEVYDLTHGDQDPPDPDEFYERDFDGD